MAVDQGDSGQVTRLLVSWSGGDQCALDALTPLVYRELRKIAAAYIRQERRDLTIQPTALVHEAYLRLVDQNVANCQNRAQFFAMASNLMRQILINHAKRHRALKRGSGNKVALDEAVNAAQPQPPPVDLLALDEALKKLARIDARQSRVVELRFFGGLTEDEVAEVLEVSAITVKRDWRIAKAVLYSQLGQAGTLL